LWMSLPAIRTQLEFWFSDANVVKDNFLRTKMKDSGSGTVPVSVLAGFKKLAAMFPSKLPVSDVHKLVTAAAKTSPFLRVLGDDSAIGRADGKIPEVAENTDDRTVYCELYPPAWSHDDLRRLCETVAPVAYVSMPRYPGSRAFKGFAFVEFATPAGAHAAVSSLDGWMPPGTSKATGSVTVPVSRLGDGVEAAIVSPGMHVMMKKDWEALKQEYTRRLDRMKAIAPVSSTLRGVCVRVDGIAESVLISSLREALRVAGSPVFVDYPGATRAHALFLAKRDRTSSVSVGDGDRTERSIPHGSAIVRYSTPSEAAFAVEYFGSHEVTLGGQQLRIRMLRDDGEEAAYLAAVEAGKAGKGSSNPTAGAPRSADDVSRAAEEPTPPPQSQEACVEATSGRSKKRRRNEK
jgi:hypothetical protein